MKSRSPIGIGVGAHVARKRAGSEGYREAHDRLRAFEELARLVIVRRARLGVSQREVAERMGTASSVVSRIESGQHRISISTLRRVAEALDGHAVVGFDFGTESRPARELVAL